MHRVKQLKYWRRKKPREGQSHAKSGYCLSDHFHRSGLEARVCDELRLRKIGKDIKSYEREVSIPFIVDGITIWTYYVDFKVTHNDGHIEFVEAKGLEFPTWKKKWRVLQHQYKDDKTVEFSVVRN